MLVHDTIEDLTATIDGRSPAPSEPAVTALARPEPEPPLAPGLYVVATPIGRLSDLSPHARAVLSTVDVVAAEDTRVTRILLSHLGVAPPMIACHDHNEAHRAEEIVARVHAGQRVALTSDAGTPGISDPGARVVAAMHAAQLPVVAVPGPSAVTALLSVAGMLATRFRFEGFLPSQPAARRAHLGTLAHCDSVVVVYESPHRILACAADLTAIFEPTRTVVVGRELTKRFEQVHRGPVGDLPAWLAADPDRQRGEFVLAVDAAPARPNPEIDVDPWLRALCAVLPPRQAARIAAQATGQSANALYERALTLRGAAPEAPN